MIRKQLFISSAVGVGLSLLLMIATPAIGRPQTVQNAATGSVNRVSLDLTWASVTLKKVVLKSTDPNKSTVFAHPKIVIADGIAASTITTTLLDISGSPVSGRTVALSSDRGGDLLTQPVVASDLNGIAIGLIRSTMPGKATLTSTDTIEGIVLSMQPQIFFTQGPVLKLIKGSNKKKGVVGDVITYFVEIKNTVKKEVVMVSIQDALPIHFKYLNGSALLNKQVTGDPSGNNTRKFTVGTVPALVDTNGNGEADPGEAGYMTLSYQVVIGAGAKPGEYINTAVAIDACDLCVISNEAKAAVKVTLDPIFELGTIIGKLFLDTNQDGWQDQGEEGLGGVMVAIDDGTYAITDKHGLFHFPAVTPGERLVKVNRSTLPPGATLTTEVSRMIQITPGLLGKVNFGVKRDEGDQGRRLDPEPKEGLMQPALESRASSPQKSDNGPPQERLVRLGIAATYTIDKTYKADKNEDIFGIHEGKLSRPIPFSLHVSNPDTVDSWRLAITDLKGKRFKEFQGNGPPPALIEWDAKDDSKKIMSSHLPYDAQLFVQYQGGITMATPAYPFGFFMLSIISTHLDETVEPAMPFPGSDEYGERKGSTHQMASASGTQSKKLKWRQTLTWHGPIISPSNASIKDAPLAALPDPPVETRAKEQAEAPGPYTPEEQTDDTIPTTTLPLKERAPKQPLFFMALVDTEVGRMAVSGNLTASGHGQSPAHYEKGRIAYYLKGTVQGKYLITSAFDTGKRGFNQIFKGLDEKETDRFFINLDPERHYPVYGDDSTVVYDAQGQGRFYLAVESDDLHLLVGNYQTDIADTELSALNRTLYGGRLEYRSLSKSAYGDPNSRVILFGAEVRQAHGQNRFRATGGSLYHLSETDLIEGSEQIQIEIRDQNSGLVLSRIDQKRESDYTILYRTGRILFNKPISSVAGNDLLIHQQILHGHPIFIVVDFEHKAGSFEKNSAGGRVRHQIGDHVAVGGTVIKDGEAASDYELKGADLTFRFGEGTRLIAEVAESEGKNGSNLISEDGGLTFTNIPFVGVGAGSAYKVAARVDLSEWFWEKDRLVTEGYYKRLDPGFFSNGTLLEQGTLKYGGTMLYQFTKNESLRAGYDMQQLLPNGALLGGNAAAAAQVGASSVSLQDMDLTSHRGPLLFGIGYQERLTKQVTGKTELKSMAGRIGWEVNERLSTDLSHQLTLDGPKNDHTTIGARYKITDNLSTLLQGTHSNRGNSALLGATTHSKRSQLFMHEKVTRSNGGDSIWGTVIGGDRMVAEGTRLYTEYEIQNGSNGQDQNRSLWGLDQRWEMTKLFNLHFHYERGYLSGGGLNTTRDAVGIGLYYNDSLGNSLVDRYEIRRDEGAIERVVQLTSHYLKMKVAANLTLFAKVNYSETRNETADLLEARFSEATIGSAYRPIVSDRFNLLTKYTHLDNQRPDPLDNPVGSDTSADIVSIDGIFDLTRQVQWVEKFAAKIQRETEPPRPSVKSQTTLSIHRLNYHVTSIWDFAVEYRILKQSLANDQLEGYLAEIDRPIGAYLRFGIGFNFSRFSDDITFDNDYNARGWFIRAQGKF